MATLFPRPYCSTCFEDLHEGHYGWDVCAKCTLFEKLFYDEHNLSWPPDFYGNLDSGKAWNACTCYNAAVVEWQTRMP